MQFHAGVAGHVFGQRGPAVVVLAADVTTIRALVQLKVPIQTACGLEGLPAHGAEDIGVA